jgi:SAM-dependent methyltransferase
MPVPTRITNRIRNVLDERLPRRLRDARWFMWPLFFVWCKGKHVREWMDFKELAPRMTVTELRDLYRGVDSLASGRLTDTNPEAMAHVLASIDGSAKTLIDVGAGSGYFLRRVQEERRFDGIRLYGCDLMERGDEGRARVIVANNEELPFRDGAFDVVTCMHTLEHSRRLDVAIAELRRICRKQLIVVVPRQKYLHYTMDMHLQFFPTPAAFAAAMGVTEKSIRRFGDDLVYVSDEARAEAQ